MKLFFIRKFIYIQAFFIFLGVLSWAFKLQDYFPKIFVAVCYFSAIGLIVINLYKLVCIKNKEFRWAVNASWHQLIFYGFLIFLIFFKFFFTGHIGIAAKLFAITVCISLILDTFTKDSYQP